MASVPKLIAATDATTTCVRLIREEAHISLFYELLCAANVLTITGVNRFPPNFLKIT